MASILNVDKIRAASGTTNVIDIDSSCNTTAMTIDSSGRVSKPVIPYAFVTWPNTGTYVAKSAGAVDFSNATVNDGNHYDTSTYQFTCPVAGLYRIESAALSQSQDQAYHWAFYRVTGGSQTLVARMYTMNRTIHGSATIKCAANDKLYIHQNSTHSFYQSSESPYSWAMYTFIG